MEFWKHHPSKINFIVYGTAFVIGVIWLLRLLFLRDCWPVHWAEFAYGFMTIASIAIVGSLVEFLHWWIRWVHSKSSQESQTPEVRKILETNVIFDALGFTLGVVERIIFCSLAILLILAGQGANSGWGGFAAVLASIAAGWVGLKTVMGYRRLTSQDVTTLRLSTASITASLLSVFLGVLAGVLAIEWFFPG